MDGIDVFDEAQVPPEIKAAFAAEADRTAGGLALQLTDRARVQQRQASSRFRIDRFVNAHRSGDRGALDTMGVKVTVKAASDVTGAAGGYLVPEFYLTDRWVDAFRSQAVLRQLGATVIPTGRDRFANTQSPLVTHAPRLTQDLQTTFSMENTIFNETDPAFGQITWTMHKEYVFVIASNEFFEDSDPALEEVLQATIAKKYASSETVGALTGTGLGQPTGILNMPDVPTTTLGSGDGASPAFGDLADAVAALETADVPGPFGIAWHPRTKQSLRKLASTGGVPEWLVSEPTMPSRPGDTVSPGTVMGLVHAASTALPVDQTVGDADNCSSLIVGDWSYGWIVEQPDLEVSVSNGPGFKATQTWLRFVRRWDFALVQPSAFQIINGILP